MENTGGFVNIIADVKLVSNVINWSFHRVDTDSDHC